MVFKREVVKDRLAFLRETLQELKILQKKSYNQLLEDTALRWAVEHGLHLSAEAIFDIGNHILVGHFSQRAVGYDLVLGELAKAGVLSLNLSKQFEKIGGFRNILVHEYTRIDFNKVYERLQNGLQDFERFIDELVDWLRKST